MSGRVAFLALMVVAFVADEPAQVQERVAAVWYRGTPAGQPRQDDLARIRATGFSAIAWPSRFSDQAQAVRRQAEVVGLRVVVADARPTAETAVIDVSGNAGAVAARAWRALQDGAALITFDAGEPTGDGLVTLSGGLRPWVDPARAFARQLVANEGVFSALEPASVTMVGVDDDPLTSRVRVSLFRTARSWLLIGTNVGERAGAVQVRLPDAAPTALWISLLDDTAMSMPRVEGTPQWTADLAPGQALVYLINRVR